MMKMKNDESDDDDAMNMQYQQKAIVKKLTTKFWKRINLTKMEHLNQMINILMHLSNECQMSKASSKINHKQV